jgi:hypothetical protein
LSMGEHCGALCETVERAPHSSEIVSVSAREEVDQWALGVGARARAVSEFGPHGASSRDGPDRIAIGPNRVLIFLLFIF